jgi:hypothetical protein
MALCSWAVIRLCASCLQTCETGDAYLACCNEVCVLDEPVVWNVSFVGPSDRHKLHIMFVYETLVHAEELPASE